MGSPNPGVETFSMIRAFLFDMDGVVVDSMTWHARSWQRVFSGMGLTLNDEEIYRREGMSGPASIAAIFSEKNIDVPSPEIIEDMMRMKHVYFEEYTIYPYPLALDILRFLKGSGMRLALVTGSGRRAVSHAIPSVMMELFETVISSDDVKRGKPDPEPYLTALSRLGMAKEETLVVENAPLGLASAGGAGLRCLAVETTLSAEHLAGADRIFRDHSSLLDYLCRMKDAGWEVL